MLLRCKPFRPFRMRLTSKSIQDVYDPRQIDVGEKHCQSEHSQRPAAGTMGWHSTISLLHLVSLESLSEKPLEADSPTIIVDQENVP